MYINMKKLLLLSLLFLSLTSIGQVLCERVAPLVKTGYTVTGTAHLEQHGTDILKLRLSDDFVLQESSPPDVRVYLSKTENYNASEVIQVANLTTISHTSGGITFDVPSGVTMNEYSYVLFYCLQYTFPVAKGELSAVTGDCNPNGLYGQNTQNALLVYPNPTSGELFFEQKQQEVKVYKLDGSLLLLSSSIDQIDIESFPAGSYIIVADKKRVIITKR